MAKSNAATKTGPAGEEIINGGSKGTIAPPAGYSQAATSVDQFWTGEGAIHGTLKLAKEYYNTLAKKNNLIFVFELLESCNVVENDKNLAPEHRPRRVAQKGEIVGVWGSAGMRDLKGLGGCLVWMTRDESKDRVIEKGQEPMKAFKIVYRGTPSTLRIIARSEAAPGESTEAAGPVGQDSIPF